MISAVFLIAIFVVFRQLKNIQRQLSKLQQNSVTQNFTLASINEILTDCTNQGKEREAKIIRALNEICQVLNSSFQTAGIFMNHTTFALENIAVCMIPFIDDIKKCALEDEDYERAQECVNIINNLKKVIENINSN